MDSLSTLKHRATQPQNIEVFMIRAIALFLLLFVGFFLGIKGFITLTGQEKLELTKTLMYSILCSIVAVSVIVTMVVLF
jgi:hypothetical protein